MLMGGVRRKEVTIWKGIPPPSPPWRLCYKSSLGVCSFFRFLLLDSLVCSLIKKIYIYISSEVCLCLFKNFGKWVKVWSLNPACHIFVCIKFCTSLHMPKTFLIFVEETSSPISFSLFSEAILLLSVAGLIEDPWVTQITLPSCPLPCGCDVAWTYKSSRESRHNPKMT